MDLIDIALGMKSGSSSGGGAGGTNGKDGKDGKSAYQIAVDNGFDGSQDEWLKSLNGKNGTDGIDGFSPTIAPNRDNDDNTYKLDITDVNGTRTTDNLKGERGSQGIQGIRGEQGDTGQQGIPGERGDRGEKGDDGYPFLIYKEYEVIEDFQASDFPEIGLMFMVKTQDENNSFPVYRYTGDGDTPYSYITGLSVGEAIKGDKGEKGDRGDAGLPGRDGKDGATYVPIIGTVTSGNCSSASVVINEDNKEAEFSFVLQKGNDGKDGITYTPSIGTVQNGDDAGASVSIDKDAKTAKFNFILPKGDKGNDGQSGKSAYQTACDNGFQGTESQWLASLKGQQGVSGKDGTIYIPKIGTVQVGNSISSADVSVNISGNNQVFDFTIPREGVRAINKGYCEYTLLYSDNLSEAQLSKKNTNPLQYLTSKNSNIPNNRIVINGDNSHILLSKNSTYKIQFSLTGLNSESQYYISDNTGKRYGNYGYFNTVDSNKINASAQAIITVTEDLKISATVESISTINPKHSYFIVEQINETISPLEYINYTDGIEDTPIGHIMAFMGTTPPKHYLACNGQLLNIEDYPYLAEFIFDQFGNTSYFGGNGTTTFAVPDLRGEFLRGTGTNSHADNGNGAYVGTHQDATQHLWLHKTVSNNLTQTRENARVEIKNEDKLIGKPSTSVRNFEGKDTTESLVNYSFYTARPTNTSVLYCIKYEPTYFMIINT